MPEWLQPSHSSNHHPPPNIAEILVSMTEAALLGLAVVGVYRFVLGRRDDMRTLPTTLVLLSVLIALVTVVIGDSVARAFGLVGALSIVRFRTVVEDTRDTAFVIFAVVVGMAAGAGYGEYAAVGLPVVAAAGAIMNRVAGLSGAPPGPTHTLTVRVGIGQEPDVLLAAVFEKFLSARRTTCVSTVKQGAALEVAYEVCLKDPAAMVAFASEANRVEGVQSVELK